MDSNMREIFELLADIVLLLVAFIIFILLSFLGFSCCKVKGFSEGDKTFFPILKRDIPIKKKQLT